LLGKMLTIFVPRKAPRPGASAVQAGIRRWVACPSPAPISWWWRIGVTMSPRNASLKASTRLEMVTR
jgi:hypothetical protein